ncbi:MAG: winged helix-turn-helix domain-containing protein [Candidatus Sungbacteria bacterium]|nr:winged helix-turn-helix domain-containing protein [Candidatus Sungbacteria bacterium]
MDQERKLRQLKTATEKFIAEWIVQHNMLGHEEALSININLAIVPNPTVIVTLHAPLWPKRGTIDERLLVYLQSHGENLCTYAELLRNVWGDEFLEGRRVDNAVARLRKRFGDDVIQTVYGKGVRYHGF